jgi:hypothetical protein
MASITSFFVPAGISGLARWRPTRIPISVRPERHASHGHGRQQNLSCFSGGFELWSGIGGLPRSCGTHNSTSAAVNQCPGHKTHFPAVALCLGLNRGEGTALQASTTLVAVPGPPLRSSPGWYRPGFQPASFACKDGPQCRRRNKQVRAHSPLTPSSEASLPNVSSSCLSRVRIGS